ncbi:hypothetical protein DPMN_119288 [Dreissena polymorpha]|uniref:Uncharacterized protein n=1 Tax=Dreissena polymorpha TaxID=45954 RepID=A0A9D4GIY9_DREPO|nr:hypothetical protein DPMN_119288 [Dreissena polymorpha]
MPIAIEIAVAGCGDWRKHSRLIRELTNIINNTDEPEGYEPLFRDRNAVRNAMEVGLKTLKRAYWDVALYWL